jgi:hypothetical protein
MAKEVASAVRQHNALLVITAAQHPGNAGRAGGQRRGLWCDTPRPVLVVPESYQWVPVAGPRPGYTDLAAVDFGNSVVSANAPFATPQSAVTVAYVADDENPHELAVGTELPALLLRDVSQV